MKIWQGLENIKTDGPWDKYFGICSNITSQEDIQRGLWDVTCLECFQKWEEYSGNPDYPIRGYDDYSPSYAFKSTPEHDMWNPDHPYGAARLRLLDHCIKYYKELDI